MEITRLPDLDDETWQEVKADRVVEDHGDVEKPRAAGE